MQNIHVFLLVRVSWFRVSVLRDLAQHFGRSGRAVGLGARLRGGLGRIGSDVRRRRDKEDEEVEERRKRRRRERRARVNPGCINGAAIHPPVPSHFLISPHRPSSRLQRAPGISPLFSPCCLLVPSRFLLLPIPFLLLIVEKRPHPLFD